MSETIKNVSGKFKNTILAYYIQIASRYNKVNFTINGIKV